jgi:DNA-binding Lrp family transcriptional regulator
MEIYSIMLLDKKDLRILEILKENSKLTTHMISKRTGIPITTIHNRIKKMQKQGVIKNYTLNLNHKKLGKPVLAFVFINPNYRILREKKITQKGLIDNISKIPSVEEIYHITGRYDIVAKVRAKDIEELNDLILDFLEKNYAITKTETMIVLSGISNH